jgi:Ca2+-binding RTX toxin-like protein
LEGTVKRVAVLGLIGFVAVPGVADAATTCRGNTLTAVGSTIVTVSYRATGVTFRDVHQDAETPCGTLTDPWTIHYRGGSATGGDLVTVAMYDAAPRIDLDTIIGGPGFDSLHGDYGKDFIDAADGGVDEVRGGRNYDRAIIDPNDDVKNIQKVEA